MPLLRTATSLCLLCLVSLRALASNPRLQHDKAVFSSRTTSSDLLSHYRGLFGTEHFLEGRVAVIIVSQRIILVVYDHNMGLCTIILSYHALLKP